MLVKGSTQTHFVKQSTYTNKNFLCPGAIGKSPKMSIPQTTKGHTETIGCNSLVGQCVKFPCLQHWMHLLTKFEQSNFKVGQQYLALNTHVAIVFSPERIPQTPSCNSHSTQLVWSWSRHLSRGKENSFLYSSWAIKIYLVTCVLSSLVFSVSARSVSCFRYLTISLFHPKEFFSSICKHSLPDILGTETE